MRCGNQQPPICAWGGASSSGRSRHVVTRGSQRQPGVDSHLSELDGGCGTQGQAFVHRLCPQGGGFSLGPQRGGPQGRRPQGGRARGTTSKGTGSEGRIPTRAGRERTGSEASIPTRAGRERTSSEKGTRKGAGEEAT